MTHSHRAFTLIELLVVVAIVGFLASAVLASISDARLEASDRKRIADLKALETAFHLYANDHGRFPRESEGANGNVSTNPTLRSLLAPYIQSMPIDPRGSADPTFHYYYDGAHICGAKTVAIIFARQMEKSGNANYLSIRDEACGGSIGGEGRGGGVESFNIILGAGG